MKQVLLIFLLLTPFALWGQNSTVSMSRPMLKFANACLLADEGVSTRNSAKVQTSVDSLMDMKLSQLRSPRFHLEAAADTVALKNHLVFNAEFLDSLMLSGFAFDDVRMTPPELLRDDDMPDVGYTNVALSPKGSATFVYKGSGNRELLVIPETGAPLNVILNDDTNNVHQTTAVSDGKAYLSWKMPRFSSYKFTIHNPSDKTVSLVIGINL